MEPRNVYAGIFAEEPGQQLLNHSIAQIGATLGTAWEACEAKEDRLGVFGKCMDLVDTWNDKTFAEEAGVFAAQPRSQECWRSAFADYVRQLYHGTKAKVRVTVPHPPAYVQLLLTNAAKHPDVRSGRYFECDSSLERKDVAMDVIRQSMAQLCDEFVLRQDPATDVGPELGPDDSASQVGVRPYRAAPASEGSSVSRASSRSSHTAPPVSVTVMAPGPTHHESRHEDRHHEDRHHKSHHEDRHRHESHHRDRRHEPRDDRHTNE